MIYDPSMTKECMLTSTTLGCRGGKYDTKTGPELTDWHIRWGDTLLKSSNGIENNREKLKSRRTLKMQRRVNAML